MAVVLAGLALGLIFFGVTEPQETKYSATATLLLKNPTSAEALYGSGAPASAQSIERELATSEELVGLGSVAVRSSEQLEGLSPDAVAGMVNVSKGSEVDLVLVEATAGDAAQAKAVANVYARQYIAFRTVLEQAKLSEARTLVERKLNSLPKADRKSDEGKQLHTTAAKLAALGTLQTGGAALISPATLPGSPSSPKPLRNALIGLLLGLLLGLGGVLFFDRLRGRLISPADMGRALGLPVLAVLSGDEATDEAEFHSTLEPLTGRPRGHGEAVLITAIRSEEDAGILAWELARSASRSATVLMVEASSRQPSPAARHQLSATPGLGELLAGEVSFETAVQRVSNHEERQKSSGFDVLVVGSDARPTALAGEGMRDLLDRSRENYDLVLIDASAIGTAPDAFPLVREADGVIVACRLGWNSEIDTENFRVDLDRLGASTLGVVVLKGADHNPSRSRRLRWPRFVGPPTGARRGQT